MSINKKDLEKWLRKHWNFLDKFIATAPQTYVDGLGLKKLESDNDDSLSPMALSFLTKVRLKKYLGGESVEKKWDTQEIMTRRLTEMNEHEVFMELVKDIASELDVDLLCHKIMRNVSILTKSDRGSLFLTRGDPGQKILVTKLFDVTETSTLKDSLRNADTEIVIPFGTGIVGHVALSKEEVNIKNAYDDPRFNKEIDKKTGYQTHSLLCLPILNNESDVIGVAQIMNKRTGTHEFTQNDVEIFAKYLLFCGIGLMNAQLFEMALKEYRRNNLLLKLARGIFEEQGALSKLMQKIMLDSHNLLQCEHSTVYLLEDYSGETMLNRYLNIGDETVKSYDRFDEVKFSMAFRLFANSNGKIEELNAADIEASAITKICKLVIVQKKTVNCPNLRTDERFCHENFNVKIGLPTHSVLSMPIFNSKMGIIGVTLFTNKEDGYDDNDENVIEAFSIFAGLGIHNCIMYENMCKLMAKQKVALEVLSYHATASEDEVLKLCTHDLNVTDSWGISTYEFDDTNLDTNDMVKVVMKIFCNVNVAERFRIPYEILCRWTLSVRKNYRTLKYHNWHHVVNVFQSMYVILYTGKLKKYFTDIDIFALLAACLCHDLDNQGANHAPPLWTDSPLAKLYGTSIRKHHHIDQCIMILNSDGNNIFMSLSPDDYNKALNVLEEAILSTDVAIHLKRRDEFMKIMADGHDFRKEEHKRLLSAMMMTVCDLATTCKPWNIQYRTALMVAAEEVDLERELNGQKPISKMNWNMKPDLPDMQIDFINEVCIPLFIQFKDLNPALSPLYFGLTNNRKVWQKMNNPSFVRAKSKMCVLT